MEPMAAAKPCDLDSVRGRFLWWRAMALRGIVSVCTGVAIVWHATQARADAADVEALTVRAPRIATALGHPVAPAPKGAARCRDRRTKPRVW